MDILALQGFMGHDSIGSTIRYVHLATAQTPGVANTFGQLGKGGAAHA